VVVSDIEENCEVVEDSGIVFQSQSVDDLETKLRDLVHNPENVSRFGALAKEHILRKYNWDRVTLQYEQLYQSLLSV
jgi:glycosyltransferase involved in cell wall biosynthesis